MRIEPWPHGVVARHHGDAATILLALWIVANEHREGAARYTCPWAVMLHELGLSQKAAQQARRKLEDDGYARYEPRAVAWVLGQEALAVDAGPSEVT